MRKALFCHLQKGKTHWDKVLCYYKIPGIKYKTKHFPI